jgi:hypothetical protein
MQLIQAVVEPSKLPEHPLANYDADYLGMSKRSSREQAMRQREKMFRKLYVRTA